MALRRDEVRAKLRHLAETLERLGRLLAAGRSAFLSDRDLHWAVERGTQVAAEAVFDAGNHILAEAFRIHAEHYRDIVPGLVARGVIPAELGVSLAGLAGLRNLLVHDYAAVDHGRLFDDLSGGIPGLSAFAAAVESWLSARGDGQEPAGSS